MKYRWWDKGLSTTQFTRLQVIKQNYIDAIPLTMICLGDFLQLKPVNDTWLFGKTNKIHPQNIPILFRIFHHVPLTKIVRQKIRSLQNYFVG